jgi:PAS domain-containing protein
VVSDLRALIDTANAPIFGIDQDGMVNEWNNKAAEITAFKKKCVHERRLAQLRGWLVGWSGETGEEAVRRGSAEGSKTATGHRRAKGYAVG